MKKKIISFMLVCLMASGLYGAGGSAPQAAQAAPPPADPWIRGVSINGVLFEGGQYSTYEYNLAADRMIYNSIVIEVGDGMASSASVLTTSGGTFSIEGDWKDWRLDFDPVPPASPPYTAPFAILILELTTLYGETRRSN